jgi:membrane-bound lytic murein transglycosylase B
MRFLTLAPMALLYCSFAVAGAKEAPGSDWTYVQKRLTQAQLPASFIAEMKKIYKPNDFIKVLELNILLFLRQTDYHTPQVSTDAIGEVRSFVDRNKKAFDRMENEYGITREAISSLLYIETRHGANKGSFHVASVFLSLLQADRPTVTRYLKSRIPHHRSKADKALQAKITKRSKQKADWALAEIKALSDIHKRDKKVLTSLKGSFSGAFGMAQFIPSSYVNMARALKKGKSADLSKPDDAIASVAHYLFESGWRKKKTSSHKRALMRYNNSEDYAEAILSLAKRATPTKVAQREVQSVKKTTSGQSRGKPRRAVGAR